jgi:hypothetical protein
MGNNFFPFLFWAHNIRLDWQAVGEEPKSGPMTEGWQEFDLHATGFERWTIKVPGSQKGL